jgi:hypothetical protein
MPQALAAIVPWVKGPEHEPEPLLLSNSELEECTECYTSIPLRVFMTQPLNVFYRP